MGNEAAQRHTTLQDWEAWLAPQVGVVELLGEIPITAEECQQLGKVIGLRLSSLGLSQTIVAVKNRYPSAFAVFLVAQGIYGYGEYGGYWPYVGQALGRSIDPNWARELGLLFEEILDDLGLPRFPDLGGRRYVDLILMHGGIPDYCLDDFFANMLRPAVTRSVYADMSVQELIDELLLRSSGRYVTDKPVLRFLEFGGRLAEDFVERSRELAGTFLETGLVPSVEEVGLPSHVVERFHDWAVERDGFDLSKTDGVERAGLRLRRPEILLDPWGEGVTLDLPPQQIPATMSQAEIIWRVSTGGRSFEVPVHLRRAGYDLRTTAESLLLDAPCELYEVSLWIDDQPQRTWRYHGPDPEHPLLVFDAGRGALLRRGPSLLARPLWLLYPREVELEVTGDARLLEEFPPLPWGWSGFRGQAWDLSQATGLTLHHDGKRFEIAVRPDEEAKRPQLVGGDLYTISVQAAAEVPLYLGSPPWIRVPLAGRTTPVEELGRWRLSLRNKWAAYPRRDLSLPLVELRLHLKEVNGLVELPLSALPLLGEAPYGNFVVRLRGPLGRDAELPLRVLPRLTVTGHEKLYLPDPQAGPPPVVLLIKTEPETRIELQGEEADDCLADVTKQEGSWLHQVQAGPETTLLEVNVVKTVPGGEEAARVPLRIPIHRLRWALQDASSATPLSKLLNGQVIVHPVEALLQADTPMLIVELPGVDARTLRMALRLLDVDGGERQAQDLTSSRSGQVRWRFELDRFADTIRLSDSPILRFVLEIDGLPAAPEGAQVPLMRLTQSLMVEGITITPIVQDEEVRLKINWTSPHPLRNRFIRFWPLWQPWEAPIYQPIPDEARGEFLIHIDPNKPQLQPSKYRLELGIADPWAPPIQIQRPAPGAQNTLDVALVSPERRLRIIDEKGKTQGGTFALALEYAIIQRELGREAPAKQALQGCYQQLDAATIPQILALVDHLEETGDTHTLKAAQLKLFAPRRIESLLSAYHQGRITPDQFRGYLAHMPRAELVPVQTARLLLGVQDARVELPALQRLIQHRELAVIDHILARCKSGAMSDADALAMLSLEEDWAGNELEKRADDPVALRLLGNFSGVHLVKVSTWVQCMAGWGQIQHIVRLSDEGAVEYFLRKGTGYRLGVILRPRHDAEPVTVEVLEDRCKLQFERAQKLYRCTKAQGCCFITSDVDLLRSDHNRAAHGGLSPQFAIEHKSVFLSVQPPKYSARAPRNVLV
jgi:hypothetical protein